MDSYRGFPRPLGILVEEAIAASLALFVGVLALTRYYSRRRPRILLVGAGFLGAAVLDGLHALITASPFASYAPSALADLIPWSWFVSRAYLAVMLLLSWVFTSRESHSETPSHISEAVVFLGTLALVMVSLAFFLLVPLPQAHLPEAFFHRPEGLIPAILFLATLTPLLRQRAWHRDAFDRGLIMSLALGFVGQALYMSRSAQVFDAMFHAAHVLKILSYVSLLISLVVSTVGLFRQAEANARALSEAKRALEQEVAERRKMEEALRDLNAELEQRVAERTEALRRSEANFRHLFHNNPLPMWVCDQESLRFLEVNEAALQHYGYNREEFDRMTLLDIGSEAEVEQLRDGRPGEGASIQRSGPWVHRRKDGGQIEVEISSHRIEFLGRPALLIVINDVTKLRQEMARRSRLELRRQIGYEVTKVLAQTTSIEEAFPALLERICQGLGWVIGELWLPDPANEAMVLTKFWIAPGYERAPLVRRAASARFRRGEGLPGRVWQTGEATWVEDVQQEAVFDRKQEAISSGIHTGMAFPIRRQGEVVGVLTFFAPEVYSPDQDLLRFFDGLGEQIGAFLERVASREALHAALEAERRARQVAEVPQERLRFLAEASETLSSSLDFQEILKRIAQLAVPTIADWCAVDILDDEGGVQRLAVVHTDPAKIDLVYDLQRRYPPDPGAAQGLYQVLRTGEPQIFPEIPETLLAQVARDEDHLELLRDLGLRSAIIVPLKIRDQIYGAITLAQAESGRHYGEEDLRLAQELARHASLAIENARLYQEARNLNEQLEARVRERTAQLEAANRELEAFSYTVSHDLRAPLRAIEGFSRILVEEYREELSEEARRYLDLVRQNTRQMGQLIDDLLTFSRLSRRELKTLRVDHEGLVHRVLEDLTPEMEGRQVEIRIAELPASEGDPTLLRQVWQNLLANALKFTRTRETAIIEVGSMNQNGRPVYYVRDNGVGFDMRYANKLFGVFQRLHRPEEFEGTGVGLAIVQRIIHRHGGRVWAEAEVDRGATFYFTLDGRDTDA